MAIQQKYLELKPTKRANFLEVSLDYDLGGYNLFTYKDEPRGYYLHVTPVLKSNGFSQYTGFSGLKYCVKEVARKSKKAEEEAIKLAAEKEAWLIEKVLAKNVIELAEPIQTAPLY